MPPRQKPKQWDPLKNGFHTGTRVYDIVTNTPGFIDVLGVGVGVAIPPPVGGQLQAPERIAWTPE